ncbi:2-oxo acid dehydrogenase subunit E2 [Phototrophicus methaneseepsis]|uniref:Dihydrolipoamide acetyltransferase component of pyruvate dehydrogenase complex n=1 Tax=Phototrophicus methaneseepsis TaxID=2710758 RepID=A0A7S8E7X1_9CHLR|nr:dihydrolipoamide acetyltransferase family protein [Phototrophicus methaneseepsis]QPC82001.1 2-oxo acid dehydrogenase subunit E2 [Phototrophicus methaneseepsis]
MTTHITMPQLGESVVDGTVAEWLKQVGDPVQEYEPIVRVSTDKVDTEIPAPASGTLLAIHVHEGDTVDSGSILGVIGQSNENPVQADKPSNGHTQLHTHSATTTKSNSKPQNGSRYTGHVTPVVARMVAEHDINLAEISGSGRHGRITKKDVLAYMDESAADASATKPAEDIPPWEQPVDGDLFKPTVEYDFEEAATQAPTREAPTQKTATVESQKPTQTPSAQIAADAPGELIPHTPMRRSIAEHMVRSKLHTSPHVTTVFEVDLSHVVAHRQANKAIFDQQGVNLTYTPYFVAACIPAIRQYPVFNSRWEEEGIRLNPVVNMGIAVALDDGLIVPVLKNAQDYNLIGLARQINDLAERARSKRLSPDEVRNGTFTITNHGVSGSLFATPIINQPQAAILGIGAIERRVKVLESDAIAIRPCAYLSLTFDHRMTDGATADAFMNGIKQQLENWAKEG